MTHPWINYGSNQYYRQIEQFNPNIWLFLNRIHDDQSQVLPLVKGVSRNWGVIIGDDGSCELVNLVDGSNFGGLGKIKVVSSSLKGMLKHKIPAAKLFSH